jgi:hypothetical protein
VLQKLGTEVGREVYKDTWINFTMAVARELLTDPTVMYTQVDGVIQRIEQTCQGEWKRDDAPPDGPAHGIIIPDVRWPAGNEGDAIRSRGGQIARIERPDGGLKGMAAQHSSETNVYGGPVDHFLDNSSTLHTLTLKIDRMMDVINGRIRPYKVAHENVPPWKR